MDNNVPCILAKTRLGMERVAASRIEEETGYRAEASPRNFKGLVLVYGCREPEADVEKVLLVPEVERAVVVMAEARASLEDMAKAAVEAARNRISGNECFAVKTTRRGTHPFSSIDVNVVVGEAVRRSTGACVNLDSPDKVVLVEIIGGRALISVVPGSFFVKKMRPGKNPVYRLFRRISIVQMPYLGPLDSCRVMGVRIGREVQNFEVRELVIAPDGPVDAEQLAAFIGGVLEGIESRHAVQSRNYARKVERVRVIVQDLYQLVRDRRGEPIIVLEPEGDPVSSVGDELWSLIRRGGRVNVLVGSREGIPLGIYRFADLVVDIAPGITLSTEYAASSALIAFATLLHERLGEGFEEDPSDTGGG